MPENPYHPPIVPPDPSKGAVYPSSKVMWRAYCIAPAAAPLSFILLLFCVLVASEFFNFEVNPASFLVLPVIALTVGMVICYVVAAAIGMPIAFLLRNRNLLNGYSIHMAALCWAVFFSIVCGVVPTLISGQDWHHIPLVICYLACGVTPPVLLSAMVFWLLVRKHIQQDRNRE